MRGLIMRTGMSLVAQGNHIRLPFPSQCQSTLLLENSREITQPVLRTAAGSPGRHHDGTSGQNTGRICIPKNESWG